MTGSDDNGDDLKKVFRDVMNVLSAEDQAEVHRKGYHRPPFDLELDHAELADHTVHVRNCTWRNKILVDAIEQLRDIIGEQRQISSRNGRTLSRIKFLAYAIVLLLVGNGLITITELLKLF